MQRYASNDSQVNQEQLDAVIPKIRSDCCEPPQLVPFKSSPTKSIELPIKFYCWGSMDSRPPPSAVDQKPPLRTKTWPPKGIKQKGIFPRAGNPTS
eukprot:617305-Amphidinium_carterae.1